MNEREFIDGYIDCALWSSNDDGAVPFDANYSARDISADSLLEMVSDCLDFIASNATLLRASYLSSGQAGHDFWLTRNGHGAGFWDRGLGVIGERLSAAAKAYGSVDLYVGDDGLIYQS